MERYFSHGKLLLTGEYAVLDGALALAIPTKVGQHLEVTNTGDNRLTWISSDPGGTWLKVIFELKEIEDGWVVNAEPDSFQNQDRKTVDSLTKLLNSALKINPGIEKKFRGAEVETHLGFPKDWGLGSSSTLVHLVSQWTGVNPYKLLENTFGGSGYDIATAIAASPILFQRKENEVEVTSINYDPPFAEALYFVYLEKKAKSAEAVLEYRQLEFNRDLFANEITEITNSIAVCQDLDSFISSMEKHEALTAEVLQTRSIKHTLFPDYQGLVKSLGAWGGDFVLVSAEHADIAYFESRGFTTVIPYKKMAL